MVEIVPNSEPPVCRVMDYGKFQFEPQKSKYLIMNKYKKIFTFLMMLALFDLALAKDQKGMKSKLKKASKIRSKKGFKKVSDKKT